MKVLVTGGTGFLGSALVKALIKEKKVVRVLDNEWRGTKNRLKDVKGEFEFIKGDIRDKKIVAKACQGIDLVVHLAYINGTEFFYTKPELVLEIGVKGILNVLDGCKKNKIPELILISSSEVYQTPSIIPTPENVPLNVPDPLNPRFSYGGGKIISELLAINYGRKYFKRVVVVRPHNVYGPDMGWEHVIPQISLRIKKMIEDKTGNQRLILPIQGTGNETRSFIYVKDFTEGLLTIIKKGKHLEIYNIGTMEEISIKKLIEEISKYFNRKVVTKAGELSEGSVVCRCPDVTKLNKLGFKPKISLKEGLQETVEWYNVFAHLQVKNEQK